MRYKPMTKEDKELGRFMLIVIGPFWLLALLLSTLYWN